MLAAPDAAVGVANRPAPRRPEIFADWIELWALCEGDRIYSPMVADRLLEEEFALDSDHAYREIEAAWQQLSLRAREIGDGYPFIIGEGEIVAAEDPWLTPVYGFLLAASACEYFSSVRFAPNSPHRDLFEHVTVVAVSKALPGWEVLWCGARSPELRAAGGVVQFVGGKLRTVVIEPTYFRNAKDGGVDFLAIWRGSDERDGRPVLWGQCASGITDWTNKTQEPNFDRWRHAVRISTMPVRAFAVPWALDRDAFRLTVADCAGWVLDRVRLAEAGTSLREGDMAEEIRRWGQSVVQELPTTE